MSERPFDMCAKWDAAECRRFLESMKRRKIEFCKQHGIPIPPFDKEEDFYITTEMMVWAQGKEAEPKEYLKPCPFCGGEARPASEDEWGSGQYIICSKCGSRSKSFWGHMDRNKLEAKNFWNTRAEIP